MFSWIGFRQEAVYYKRAARYAGSTKYPLRKMLRLALDAVISFSNVPLRLTLNLGFAISLLSFVIGLFWLGLKLFGMYTVPGWASIVVAIMFLGGVQLLMTGIIGEYLGRIYEEVRRRPLYFVRDVRNSRSGAERGEEQKAFVPAASERAVVSHSSLPETSDADAENFARSSR